MKTTNVDVYLKMEMRINYHCSSGPEENHENYKKKDSVLVQILTNRLPNELPHSQQNHNFGINSEI